MAKKQLKKLNQPKKYLQGGSNMASVAQTRQNPYYIGQVNANAAEDQFQSTQDQLAQARLDAVQAQKDSEAQQKAALDQSIQQSVGTLGKAAMADKMAGNLGKLWVPATTASSSGIVSPTLQSSILAASNTGSSVASAASGAANTGISTITGIGGAPITSSIGASAPGVINIGATGIGGAPIVTNTATNAGTTIAGNAGSTAATGMSSLTSAGIGIAANVGGKIIQKRADDNSAYTFTDKERRGNVGGGALASAGTGFSTGAMIGSFVPGLGNVVGGLIGAGVGAGIGALKARKENKASQEEADRLQREQAALRGAYQSASINSKLTGPDTGFGLNSSTNMNNNFTNQYQVAKLGGVKKVPGGQIVPIEGTDAVEFKGKSHENGGVTIDRNTEVEGGETMDQVAMNNNNKQDYIFSKYLKLGGKSFAQRHKEILKGSGSQADIQQLASMQEKVAGRDSQQVAAYGGFHKYLEGGVKPCPECPPGTICDVATGACVPDEDSGSGNSYDWNATGVEGFKAKQNAANPAATTAKQEPAKPAGPTLYFNNDTKKYTYRDEKGAELMSGYDQNRLTNQMNAQRPGATGFDQQLADVEKRETPGVKPPVDNQTAITAQNGTSNAPADNKVPAETPNGYTPVKLPFTALESEKFDPKGSLQAWAKSYGKEQLTKSMAESEAYDAELKKAIDSNFTYTDEKGKEVTIPYDYDPATGYFKYKKNYESAFLNTPERILYKNGKPEETDPGTGEYKTAFRESPEDIAALQKEGFYKKKNGDGAMNDWKQGAWKDNKFVEFKNDPAFAAEQGYDVPGYTAPAGVKPPENKAPEINDMASLEEAWSAGKISLGDYMAKVKEFEPAPSANTTTSNADNTNSVIQPTATTTNTGTQPIDQEEQDWRNHWIKQGYVFNAAGERELPAGKKLVVNDDGSEQIVDDTQSATGTATYTTPAGITPNGNKQSATQTDNTVAPDGTKLPAGYVWDATLNAPVSSTAMTASSNSKGGNAPNASQTVAATGTNTSTNTNAGTTAGPTVTYTNSKNPNDPTATKQTPEEIEAARLAGLPRMFMGASRKVDETTGNVTIDKGKPLMGVGAMAGSRLGTATGSQEDLAKVTRNSYDQAWTNKADNLYTNQKDAGGGGLSSSDAIADRDKIAESNWGKKYGYTKGMSADEAKAAHGKFATDVKSLFANNPDEMMGYFQYIIDGGVNDPKNPGTYLGKDAEQIRNNLKAKGYIDANGQAIAGKVVAGKTMAQYLEDQATNNAVGPIHNALGSYTAERGSTRIKLEEKKKKDEVVTQELPKKFEPCPPGTYRSTDGTCKSLGDVPQGNKITGSMLAGLGQLIPVGAALMNPYKIAPGIVGAPGIKGALMPRVNLNQERASAIQQNVAYKNAVVNQNAGPGALAAMQMSNTKTNDQMLKIGLQEQDSNFRNASEENKLGMQASMFNAETEQKRQMFNTEFNQKERQYRREDLLGALDTGAARIAGIVKDERSFKSQERLANALDETGSYDRFSILEELNKEAKRKNSPYYGTTETERRRMAAAMHKELNPEGYVSKSEYTKLQEEKAKVQKEKEELEKAGKAKFGGARQYVSRLGQLSGVRATKAKI